MGFFYLGGFPIPHRSSERANKQLLEIESNYFPASKEYPPVTSKALKRARPNMIVTPDVYVLILTFTLALLLHHLPHKTSALPQITVSKWPPAPPLPSICGVLSATPACPYGYACHPFVDRYCEDLDDEDELCGYCSPTPIWTPTPTPTPSVAQNSTTPIITATSSCPSGYVGDYRGWCRDTSTSTSKKSSSTFTCPSGFVKDYRGMEYCRPTYYVARATQRGE